MGPKDLELIIEAALRDKVERPLYITGSPGIGKTSIPKQVAVKAGIGLLVNHVPLQQPEDHGIPVPNADRTKINFLIPEGKFPVEGSDCPDHGILVQDELAQGDDSSMKINANIFLSREIHGKKLKPGWIILGTGNRAADKSGAKQLLKHLQGRVTEVELEVSLDDWRLWALQNGVKPEVIAFIGLVPKALNEFDPHAHISPTPRGWVDGVSARLGTIPKHLEAACFAGDIGPGRAAEFCGFLNMYRNMISPEQILLNPATAKVPTDPSILYALTGALAYRASPDNFDSLMTYVTRMPQEFTVLFIKDASKRNDKVASCPSFTRFMTGPGAKLFT